MTEPHQANSSVQSHARVYACRYLVYISTARTALSYLVNPRPNKRVHFKMVALATGRNDSLLAVASLPSMLGSCLLKRPSGRSLAKYTAANLCHSCVGSLETILYSSRFNISFFHNYPYHNIMEHAPSTPKPFRVVVVGAGIVGLSILHALQRANIDHVVLGKIRTSRHGSRSIAGNLAQRGTSA